MTETSLCERLFAFVDLRFGSNWAELARQTGIAPSVLHKMKEGGDVRQSTLIRLAEATGLSLDWLLMGRGDMLLGDVAKFNIEKSTKTLLANREDIAVQDSRWTELESLGRRGGRAGAWKVLGFLNERSPGWVTFSDVARQVRASSQDEIAGVEADLLLLSRWNLIERDGIQYRLKGRVARLRSNELSDTAQLAMEAVTELLSTVVPAADRGSDHGRIFAAELRLTPGKCRELLLEITEKAAATVTSASAFPGEDVLRVIVGCGIAKGVEPQL